MLQTVDLDTIVDTVKECLLEMVKECATFYVQSADFQYRWMRLGALIVNLQPEIVKRLPNAVTADLGVMALAYEELKKMHRKEIAQCVVGHQPEHFCTDPEQLKQFLWQLSMNLADFFMPQPESTTH